MARAGWLFSKAIGTGAAGDDIRPSLADLVGGKWTSPGDVISLRGPAAQPHNHLLVGGVALPDDFVGDGHKHFVLFINGQWQQVTVGAQDHTHTLDLASNGRLMPDYFLVFWEGSDAEAAVLNADPDNYLVVEADVNTRVLDNTQWTAQEQITWETRILNLLGVQLPAEVDRGKRLVQLFLGALLSRQTDNEEAYRF